MKQQSGDLRGFEKPRRSADKIAISRRAFLRMAGLTAAGVALAACVPRSSTGAGPHGSDSAQLVYQDWRTEWFSAMAQRMLDQFHASHPNIHVFFTEDPEDLAGGMEVDFQENTAPDVVDGC